MRKLLLVVFAMVVVVGPTAWAGVAKVSFDPGRVQWEVQGEYDGAVLTVSLPGGEVVRQEFVANETPIFELASDAKDGAYTYELRPVPRVDASLRKALIEARTSGDEAAIARLQAELPESPVVAGGFMVQAGSIVMPEGKEPQADKVPKTATAAGSVRNVTAEEVFTEDMIFQGSACVGLDCVDPESFGLDKIRLKENNLRIHFDDTSTSAGFPANDWRLIANDSASGGSSKFSIEDSTGAKVPFTITAGASTNSIFVDSTGRVGFRTATPVLDLHVATSNTPAIRLEQTSSSFPAQTWDIGANEAHFFVRDVTGGSLLSFRIRPGAPTSSVDISADGDVGIGTGSPDQKLHVEQSSDVNTIGLVENTSGGTSANASWSTKNNAGAQTNQITHGSGRVATRFGVALGNRGEILHTGGNGLLIGTLEADDIIMGTNNVNRLQINGSTGAATFSGNVTVNDLSASGNVGIGTASPSQKVEVELNQDANTIALIENTNTGASANAAWRASSDTAIVNLTAHGSGRTLTRFGATLASKGEILHTTGNGLVIGTLEADDIVIGTNNTNRLQINGSTGSVTISGNLTVNGTFSNPSSRELKEGFELVDPNTMLQKFALLPIQEWSYKSDDRKLRHIGPIVEDFQSAFGLGTEGQYIFPMDVQGVTMAAVQGLYQLVLDKDAQIAELQRRLDTEINQIKALLENIKKEQN